MTGRKGKKSKKNKDEVVKIYDDIDSSSEQEETESSVIDDDEALPDKVSDTLSSKGFIAIDIDGTTLVEKIDKNPVYGIFKNSESHIRESLVEYLQLACTAGYDIYVLTARPEIVDQHLLEGSEGGIGTKSTKTIIEKLKKNNIAIKGVKRASAGLKGKAMNELHREYQGEQKDNSVPPPVGILFDDQLVQLNDVAAQGNIDLIGYDINSAQDITNYLALIAPAYDEKKKFHPVSIVENVLAKSEFIESVLTLLKNIEAEIKSGSQDNVQRLISTREKIFQGNSNLDIFFSRILELINKPELNEALEFVQKNIVLLKNYPNMTLKNVQDNLERYKFEKEFKEEVHELVSELALRLYEAQARGYQPEVDWVTNAASALDHIVTKLVNGQVIKKSEVEELSRNIFGLIKPKPNSRCDVLVTNFLADVEYFSLGHSKHSISIAMTKAEKELLSFLKTQRREGAINLQHYKKIDRIIKKDGARAIVDEFKNSQSELLKTIFIDNINLKNKLIKLVGSCQYPSHPEDEKEAEKIFSDDSIYKRETTESISDDSTDEEVEESFSSDFTDEEEKESVMIDGSNNSETEIIRDKTKKQSGNSDEKPVVHNIFFLGTGQHSEGNAGGHIEKKESLLTEFHRKLNLASSSLIQGIGTSTRKKRNTYEQVTGYGIEKSIMEAMDIIEKLTEINPGKEIILNLAGFSRGAVATLRLANRLKYTHPHVTLNIFAIDPVAGFGNTEDWDAVSISSNIKNLHLVYQKDDKRHGFDPQLLSQLRIDDPEKTNVISNVYPGIHEASTNVAAPRSIKRPELIIVESLPTNNKIEERKIYVTEDRKYIVRDAHGNVRQGTIEESDLSDAFDFEETKEAIIKKVLTEVDEIIDGIDIQDEFHLSQPAEITAYYLHQFFNKPFATDANNQFNLTMHSEERKYGNQKISINLHSAKHRLKKFSDLVKKEKQGQFKPYFARKPRKLLHLKPRKGLIKESAYYVKDPEIFFNQQHRDAFKESFPDIFSLYFSENNHVNSNSSLNYDKIKGEIKNLEQGDPGYLILKLLSDEVKKHLKILKQQARLDERAILGLSMELSNPLCPTAKAIAIGLMLEYAEDPKNSGKTNFKEYSIPKDEIITPPDTKEYRERKCASIPYSDLCLNPKGEIIYLDRTINELIMELSKIQKNVTYTKTDFLSYHIHKLERLLPIKNSKENREKLQHLIDHLMRDAIAVPTYQGKHQIENIVQKIILKNSSSYENLQKLFKKLNININVSLINYYAHEKVEEGFDENFIKLNQYKMKLMQSPEFQYFLAEISKYSSKEKRKCKEFVEAILLAESIDDIKKDNIIKEGINTIINDAADFIDETLKKALRDLPLVPKNSSVKKINDSTVDECIIGELKEIFKKAHIEIVSFDKLTRKSNGTYVINNLALATSSHARDKVVIPGEIKFTRSSKGFNFNDYRVNYLLTVSAAHKNEAEVQPSYKTLDARKQSYKDNINTRYERRQRHNVLESLAKAPHQAVGIDDKDETKIGNQLRALRKINTYLTQRSKETWVGLGSITNHFSGRDYHKRRDSWVRILDKLSEAINAPKEQKTQKTRELKEFIAHEVMKFKGGRYQSLLLELNRVIGHNDIVSNNSFNQHIFSYQELYHQMDHIRHNDKHLLSKSSIFSSQTSRDSIKNKISHDVDAYQQAYNLLTDKEDKSSFLSGKEECQVEHLNNQSEMKKWSPN